MCGCTGHNMCSLFVARRGLAIVQVVGWSFYTLNNTFAYRRRPRVWPLTPKFDRETQLFLKFDMRHEAYRHATGL